MTQYVTQVASPLLAEPSATIRRPVAGATTTAAAQTDSSFQSLLARSSTEDESAAAVTGADRIPSVASTAVAVATATSPAPGASGLSDFELLFGGANYNPADPMAASRTATANAAAAAEATAPPTAPPTAQSVFGPDVWVNDPIGLNPDGSSFGYNPIYFATEGTAQTVAQMVGGSVTTENVFTKPGNAFVQQQPNYMVKMSNGAVINPGLVASFYTFGFSQSQIDTMIAQEVANTPPPAKMT